MSRQTAKRIDNEVLKEEAKVFSMRELARQYNVNYTTIFKRLHKCEDFKPKKGRPPKFKID